MKSFSDLTDAEVLALTEEQIAYYVDLECAESGAGLLPPDPGPAPEKPADSRDTIAYKVGDILFANRDDAQAVADLATAASRYESDYANYKTYEKKLRRIETPVDVASEKFYSLNGWEAAKDAVSKYNSAKAMWDAANEEYNNAAKARSEATELVHNRIAEVREDEFRRARYLGELKRYVELADGNEEIGRRFLLKAAPQAEKYLPPLVSTAPDEVSAS